MALPATGNGVPQHRQAFDTKRFIDFLSNYASLRAVQSHRQSAVSFTPAEMDARDLSCPSVSAKEKKGRCPMRTLFLGWLVAMVATVAVADSSDAVLEKDNIRVAVYSGGEQICAINVGGDSPITIRCCPTATHDINVRSRYERSAAGQQKAFGGRWVTCILIEEDVAQAND